MENQMSIQEVHAHAQAAINTGETENMDQFHAEVIAGFVRIMGHAAKIVDTTGASMKVVLA